MAKEPSTAFVQTVAKDFASGLHCSQVTLAYAAKKLGYDEKTAKKIGAGFGGGMFNGERCGALTGAMMGLGLKYGYTGQKDAENLAVLQQKVKQLEDEFQTSYSSLQCEDIIGVNIGTPEGAKKAVENNCFANCPLLTARVCMILDELL